MDTWYAIWLLLVFMKSIAHCSSPSISKLLTNSLLYSMKPTKDIRTFFTSSKPNDEKIAKCVKPVDLIPEDNEQTESLEKAIKRKKLVINDDEEEEFLGDGEQKVSCKSSVFADNNSAPSEKLISTPTLGETLHSIDNNATPNITTLSSSPIKKSTKTSIDGNISTIFKNGKDAKLKPVSTSKPVTTASVQDTDIDLEFAGEIPTDLTDFITWKAGESIPYLALVDTFEEISKVSGRLDKERLFTRLFRAVISTTPSELDSIVYLASNNVSPAYDGMELGIGDSLLVKAVCEATGRKKEAVEEAYEREGDLGTVALMSRANQKTLSFAAKPKPLLAKHVLDQYRIITQIKGEKAQGRKVDVIKAMMVKCQGSEAKYIVRALQGKLRIGTAEQTVLVALAHAFVITPTVAVAAMIKEDLANGKLLSSEAAEVADSDEMEDDDDDGVVSDNVVSVDSAIVEVTAAADTDTLPTVDFLNLLEAVHEKETPEAHSMRTKSRLSREEKCNLAEIAVKRAYSECPNLSMLANALLSRPLYRLYEACRLTIGVPVAPMLAKPTKEINEVLKRLSGQPFTMEYKYDGERAQVHYCLDGSVRIFSRNSEDNTNKYPDLLEVMKRARRDEVVSCIIDAEVVAYDREKNCLLPFQVLSTRKRKVEDGEEDSQKVKIILQAFDLLYLNGKSLLRESLRTRRTLMHASFQHAEGFFHFASGSDHVENGDTAPIEAFLQEACGAMCEGLMVKTLDDNATYEPSKRSLNWLKLKKDYIDGMGVCDSVDLVVLGGYYGRGKRTNTYGAYLMACYDGDRDEYQSVCKVGTGFKDEDLARLFEQMKGHVVPSKRKPLNYNVSDVLFPDDWFEPSTVWELQAADLSKSSVHKGGIGRVESGRGIGLRFPRYLRDRPDKKPENATSAEQIVDMFFSQGGVGGDDNGEGGGDNDEDDFDGI